jgi:hypothetical protein
VKEIFSSSKNYDLIKEHIFLKICRLTVELIVMALRAFDGKQSCMGRAWLVMKTLERCVLSLQDQPFSLPLSFANVMEL